MKKKIESVVVVKTEGKKLTGEQTAYSNLLNATDESLSELSNAIANAVSCGDEQVVMEVASVIERLDTLSKKLTGVVKGRMSDIMSQVWFEGEKSLTYNGVEFSSTGSTTWNYEESEEWAKAKREEDDAADTLAALKKARKDIEEQIQRDCKKDQVLASKFKGGTTFSYYKSKLK